METIKIKTQKEFDALPSTYKEYTIIKLLGGYIVIRQAYDNASVKAMDNASVEAYDNASVEAYDNASVKAYDNASVKAMDNASVEARGNASVEAWGNASVEAYDNASVEAWGNASVEAWDNASVEAYDNASVKAWDNASVKAYDNASVKAMCNASVEAYDNASVKAYDNASVKARGNASVEAWGNASVEAYDNAIVRIISNYVKVIDADNEAILIYQDCNGKPTQLSGNAQIIKTKNSQYSLKKFIKFYDIVQEDYALILYKSVQNNFTDFYSGKIKYKGTIICPDWDVDNNRECGGGFHLSPSISQCKKFNHGRYLKCRVPFIDQDGNPNILVHPHPQYPSKIRCRTLTVLEEVFE